MTTVELVTALEEGKLLEKDYAIAYPDSNYKEEGKCVQYLFREDWETQKIYNLSGWGSGFRSAKQDSIWELFEEPEKWRVSKFKITDRPWSTSKRQL